MKTLDEETIINESKENQPVESKESKEPKESKKNKAWVDASIGAGSGVAAGVAGAMLTSSTIHETPNSSSGHHHVSNDGLTTPVVTDGQLPIAHNVNDNMSFGEAFRTAHDEVGPGGVFEWHGQLYNTYTKEEWNRLSSEEKQEFNDHLRVVGTPDYASNVSHHGSHEQHVEHTTNDVTNHVNETHHETQDNGNSIHDNNDITDNGNEEQTDDVEVQVLGVQNVQGEDGQEVAVGGISVDGQEIYVLDADNDGIGDVALMDMNGNGEIEEDEILDLSENPVDMSTFENGGSDLCSNVAEGPDYLPESL